MKSIRIYQSGTYQVGDIVTLSPGASQHVGAVLRLSSGDTITLFGGANIEWQATLCTVAKKKISVRITDATPISRESPRSIHLAQAIAKGDKMEWIIQKAVELGVHTITPIFTERCVVRYDAPRLLKKEAQWQAIMVGAAEQSGRNTLATLHPACTLEQYVHGCTATHPLILSPKAPSLWPSIKEPTADIALLIGPEGGFSPQELAQSTAQRFQAIGLGPRILRTETAAIAALSIMQMQYGDLGATAIV